jgi:hypothetical protein
MLIDRTGIFRGKAVEAGVSLTTNGFPQFVIKCLASEYWDQANETWYDWTDVEQNEITGYLTLFDGKGQPIFHIKDIMEVFGWDGLSLSTLDGIDASKAEFQFVVEDHIYNEQSRLQVSKIAKYDAVPGASIRRVDPNELKSLDAKFAAALAKNAAPQKAATAPAKKTGSKLPPAPKKVTPPPAGTTPPAGATPPAPPAPPAPPKRSAPPKKEAAAGTAAQPKAMTMEEAWGMCVQLRAKDVTDETLAKTWSEACNTVAPDKDDADITPEQWGAIADKVNSACGVF